MASEKGSSQRLFLCDREAADGGLLHESGGDFRQRLFQRGGIEAARGYGFPCDLESASRDLFGVSYAGLDFIFQRGDDLILALQEVGPGQVRAGHSVMGDERAIVGQMLHKELQLFQHPAFLPSAAHRP